MPTDDLALVALVALSGLVLACEEPPLDPSEPRALAAEVADPAAPEDRRTAATPPEAAPAPRPIAPDARRSFERMVELVEEHYVDGPLSEDELWTGAMEGVMARLIQLEGAQINALLSPAELGHLLAGTKGSIVGVGIMIELVHDVLMVKATVPGGPAERAGLRAGDRILAIDGRPLAGVPLTETVELIRGAAGTRVELFVQRGAGEWTVPIDRGVVEVPSVEGRSLADGVGYLRIDAFTDGTVAELDRTLDALAADTVRGLVIDLRRNPGGLLEPALETAERFLAPGRRIVTIRGRAAETHHDARRGDRFDEVPLVLLVGPETASGAEILAAALHEHGRAALVGEPTRGKGTVEAIHDLSGGWGLKLSASRFFSPDGSSRQGRGVEPDFRIASPPEALDAMLADVSPQGDPALRAALELLAR
jgi:carboxyl-terminal processing protease